MDGTIGNTDVMRAVAKAVDGTAANYEKTYNNLLNNISTFTSTDWKGDDANAFRTKAEDFRDDLNKMKMLMNEYADTLRKFADNYEETQRIVKGQVDGLQG